jgi:hypothetical protein
MTPIENAGRRVSILARVVPAISYIAPAFGAALSALVYLRVMNAMRVAETAGVGAVASGIAQGNVVLIIGLYLGIFIGVGGVIVSAVRCFTTTKSDSPAGGFFAIAGLLGLLPIAPLWRAQDLLIGSIRGTTGIVEVAGQINFCLILTIVGAGAASLVLIAASFVPLPALLHAKRRYAPVIVLVLMEVVLIVIAVAYQLHNSWLYQVYRRERF